MRKFVLAALAVSVLGACGAADKFNDKRGKGDAPVGSRDDSPAQVINMPDGFSNVAAKCDDHGHRVFVTTNSNGSRQLVVVDDPECGGDAR